VKQLKISTMRNRDRRLSAFLTSVIGFEIAEFVP
jgi:hypothetical protein